MAFGGAYFDRIDKIQRTNLATEVTEKLEGRRLKRRREFIATKRHKKKDFNAKDAKGVRDAKVKIGRRLHRRHKGYAVEAEGRKKIK